MNQYLVVSVRDGLAFITSTKFGDQIWHLIRTRKPTACAGCNVALPAQSLAYRPQTNRNNRMCRLCAACVTNNVIDRLKQKGLTA